MEMAPDIPNGYVVNGVEANNSWSTRIQCVLVNEKDASQTAYLSQECRFENVPFMAENSSSVPDIIKTQSPYRFLTYTQNGLFHQFPDSDTPCRFSHPTIDLGGRFLIPAISGPDWTSQAYCAQKEIEPIGLAELLEGLNDRTIAAGHIHVRIALDDGLVMYFPAGYINFSNRGIEPAKYIQSISGDVLFPVEDTLACGYIVCAMALDGRMKIEFVTKTYTELQNSVFAQTEYELLKKVSELSPMYIGVMNYVVDVDGDVQFFRYK